MGCAVDVGGHDEAGSERGVAIEPRTDRKVGAVGSFDVTAFLFDERVADDGKQGVDFEERRHVVVGEDSNHRGY